MSSGFTLKIDKELAQSLAFRAALLGVTREELAVQLLQEPPFNYDDYTWIGDDPRAASLEPYDGPTRPWSEVRPELLEYLESQLRKRPGSQG